MSLTVRIMLPPMPASARRFMEALAPARREALNRQVAHAVQHQVSTHLADAARGRHATADRLGATPTGHLERAAENVGAEATGEGAVISIESPGIGRARGPITITPREKKFLTIPTSAESYGRKAGSLSLRLFRPQQKGSTKDAPKLMRCLATTDGGTFRILYALAERATLKHDPGLLPSDEAITEAAKTAIKFQLEAERRSGEGASS